MLYYYKYKFIRQMSEQNSTLLDYKQITIATVKEQFGHFIIGLLTIVFALTGTSYYIRAQGLSFPSLSFLKWQQTQPQAKQSPPKHNDTMYVVKEGEGLWQIAEQKYGTGEMMSEIMTANNIIDPNTVIPGQKLVLPPANPTIMASISVTPTLIPSVTPVLEQGQISATQTKQVTIKGNNYVVQEGDGIWDIAERAYGDGMMWTKIVEANKLGESYNLEIGRKLKIPR